MASAKRKVAIFDIDGTIFRSSLLVEAVETMVQKGIFPLSVRSAYAKSYARWMDRRGNYSSYITDVIAVFDKHIKGMRHEDFKRVAAETVAFHGSRVYRYARDLVADLKKRNYYLLAISHSPKELVDPFCRNLGFSKVYGRLYEIDEKGIFTGGTKHKELIGDKSKILERAIEKEHLTLTGSVGVGDSEGDISFLSMVSRPICFNPNQALYKKAKQLGWSVVVERKDVIYKL